MTPVIIAVLLVFVFFMLWNIVMMLDIKQLEAKHVEAIEDIWHHVNGNKNEADAREYTHINNSDCLFTEAQKIRADYDKSVTNITALAKKLGYEWAVTTNGKVCPGYWAKIGTKATKPHVYADKRSHSKKKVSARGII